jgi:hypothetical protein
MGSLTCWRSRSVIAPSLDVADRSLIQSGWWLPSRARSTRTPEMVALAREKAAAAGVSNVEFRVDDGYELPYPDGSFDAIMRPFSRVNLSGWRPFSTLSLTTPFGNWRPPC